MEKMDVFISWSGVRSRAVADALKKYLPMVVNDLRPWLSSADITKGARSMEEVAGALANARAGIICLTPSNLNQPWILFEAGAIAKTVRQKPLACTLLIDLEIAALRGPLTQFQATKPTHSDMLALVKTLNQALGDGALNEHQVAEAFDLCWPKLKETFEHLPTDRSEKAIERTPDDMLKEIVELTRTTNLTVLELQREILEKLTAPVSHPSYFADLSKLGGEVRNVNSFYQYRESDLQNPIAPVITGTQTLPRAYQAQEPIATKRNQKKL